MLSHGLMRELANVFLTLWAIVTPWKVLYERVAVFHVKYRWSGTKIPTTPPPSHLLTPPPTMAARTMAAPPKIEMTLSHFIPGLALLDSWRHGWVLQRGVDVNIPAAQDIDDTDIPQFQACQSPDCIGHVLGIEPLKDARLHCNPRQLGDQGGVLRADRKNNEHSGVQMAPGSLPRCSRWGQCSTMHEEIKWPLTASSRLTDVRWTV